MMVRSRIPFSFIYGHNRTYLGKNTRGEGAMGESYGAMYALQCLRFTLNNYLQKQFSFISQN